VTEFTVHPGPAGIWLVRRHGLSFCMTDDESAARLIARALNTHPDLAAVERRSAPPERSEPQ
jgi:hypothetical protein